MKKFFNWVKELSPWAQVSAIIGAFLLALLFFLFSSCKASHTVQQSSSSSQVTRGDTTFNEVTIRYEQVGNMKKGG